MARMSAHETVMGHSSSSKYFMLSINSNPRKEFTFGPASFSLVMPSTLSRSTDASQPLFQFNIQQMDNKKRIIDRGDEKLKQKKREMEDGYLP